MNLSHNDIRPINQDHDVTEKSINNINHNNNIQNNINEKSDQKLVSTNEIESNERPNDEEEQI